MFEKVIILFFLLLGTFVQANQFGHSGRDGNNGRDGSNGSNGQNVQIYTDGGYQQYDLRGDHALDNASDGQDGSDASLCYQPRDNYDVYGASGGDGGHGGDGGNGGDGGDATIFYSHISDLSKISLLNSAGEGAPGARGAYGGRACECSDYSWSRQYCWNDRQCRNVKICKPRRKCRTERQCVTIKSEKKCRDIQKCETIQECRNERRCRDIRRCEDRRYTCRDGRDGSRGRDGSYGSTGSRGSIKIIKNLQSIPSVQPYAIRSALSLSNQTMTLSQNIWANKSGAKSLFARNSDISDQYTEFIETQYNFVTLEWNAPQSISSFSNLNFELRFSASGYTNIQIKTNHLVDYKIIKEGDRKSIIVINEVYKTSDVNQLSQQFKGRKSDLKIIITDKAKLSKIIKTGVYLNLELGQLLGSKTLFNGRVPESKMTVLADKIIIHAGHLASEPKKMRKGRKIKYSLSITRSFGRSSAQVNLKQDKTKVR